MNTIEVSKLTNMPVDLLRRMRSRETRSLKSGPPFCKVLDKNLEPRYVYKKIDVQKWMKWKRCLLTAGDAALILNITRQELLEMHGLQGIEVRKKKYNGRLIINNARNVYIWIPRKKMRK